MPILVILTRIFKGRLNIFTALLFPAKEILISRQGLKGMSNKVDAARSTLFTSKIRHNSFHLLPMRTGTVMILCFS